VQHFNALLADLVSGETFTFHITVIITLWYVCICEINSGCWRVYLHLPRLSTPSCGVILVLLQNEFDFENLMFWLGNE
jgi:hypothetical protein